MKIARAGLTFLAAAITLSPALPAAAAAAHAAAQATGAIEGPATSLLTSNSATSNWSGRFGLGSTREFNTVHGDWIVPTVNCSNNASSDASMWVGLGRGTDRDPLFQTGTDMACVDGAAQYDAWWAEYPSNSGANVYKHRVWPGDYITAGVTFNGASRVSLSIADYRPSGQARWIAAIVTLPDTDYSRSAECVVERPLVDGSPAELSDFGQAIFTDCEASIQNGSTTYLAPQSTIPDAHVYNIKIWETGARLDTLVRLESNGGFTAIWNAAQ